MDKLIHNLLYSVGHKIFNLILCAKVQSTIFKHCNVIQHGKLLLYLRELNGLKHVILIKIVWVLMDNQANVNVSQQLKIKLIVKDFLETIKYL